MADGKIFTVRRRENVAIKQTKTSVFIKVLIKIGFLPISIDKLTDTITFKFLSLKTLVYIVMYIGPNILINVLWFWSPDAISQFNTKQNLLEVASGWFTMISGLCLLLPLGTFINIKISRIHTMTRLIT